MTPHKRKGREAPDWEAIRTAFVESPIRKSYRTIAQEFKVPNPITVYRHYSKENWEKLSDEDGVPGALKKPPLGVLPNALWKELRVINLSGAIRRRISAKLTDGDHAHKLREWFDELRNVDEDAVTCGGESIMLRAGVRVGREGAAGEMG